MDNNNTKTVVKHFDKVIYASIINEQSVKNKKRQSTNKKTQTTTFFTTCGLRERLERPPSSK